MPTNREKRPRWLMICKCGATVKASRIRPESPLWALGTGAKGRFARDLAKTAPGEPQPAASSGQDASGRNDRGGLEGRDHGVLEGVTLTLEQHPPLESARAHDGKAGQDLFPPAPEPG